MGGAKQPQLAGAGCRKVFPFFFLSFFLGEGRDKHSDEG